ncbi:MAG TPA: hypothetical protein QF446_13440 [Planctomycetota bacterium]|nr:hypothetical protein [Planctomycetota bacterium]
MAQPLQSRNARRGVFPWRTTVVALGLVLWLRGDGTGDLVEGATTTQLSWPKGAAPGAGERAKAKTPSSGSSSSSQTPIVDPIQSGRGSGSGASPSVPSPR